MSPLVFEDTYTVFQDKMLSALGQICPGASIDVDENGELDLKGLPPCENYCTHRAGCNLLKRVMSDPSHPPIRLRWGTAKYIDSASENVAYRYTLYWGGTEDTVALLAHELIHALHDYDKVLQGDETDEEECTSCGENQIRCELGVPDRLEYYEGVPLHCESLEFYGDCTPLSTKNETECDCDQYADECLEPPKPVDRGKPDDGRLREPPGARDEEHGGDL
jgi:hypothetical protein